MNRPKDWWAQNPHFKSFRENVIGWNLVASGGKHDVSEERIDYQLNLVTEEFTELMDAFEDGNIWEVMKEACDVFVTCAYYDHLLKLTFTPTEDEPYDTRTIVVGDNIPLMQWIESVLVNIKVDSLSALTEVCNSNWAKYLHRTPGNEGRIDEVVAGLTEKYKGRYSGIHAIKSDNWIVFKDDQEKVMKGPDYHEPNLINAAIGLNWQTIDIEYGSPAKDELVIVKSCFGPVLRYWTDVDDGAVDWFDENGGFDDGDEVYELFCRIPG